MGFILKIIIGAVILIWVKSWITQKTLEKLPGELPTSLPEISVPDMHKKQHVDQKVDTTDRIRIASKNFDESPGECTTVDRAFGQAFDTKDVVLQGMNSPRIWTLENASDKTIAVLIGQQGVKFAVAYAPPYSTYKAKIPSTGLMFIIKATNKKCINHRSAGGLVMHDPSHVDPREGGISGDFSTSVEFSDSEGLTFNNQPLR